MDIDIFLYLFNKGLPAEVVSRLAGLLLQLLLHNSLSCDTCVVSSGDEEGFIS